MKWSYTKTTNYVRSRQKDAARRRIENLATPSRAKPEGVVMESVEAFLSRGGSIEVAEPRELTIRDLTFNGRSKYNNNKSGVY